MRFDRSILKDIVILTLITLAAGALLGVVYAVTEEPIQRQNEAVHAATQLAVFEDAAEFEDLQTEDREDEIQGALADAEIDGTEITEISIAKDGNGDPLGYVIGVKNSEGYGGDIEVMVGIRNTDGEPIMNAISFLQLDETAGMGMKAKEEPFITEFEELVVSELLEYSKTGASAANEIDAISGATVTTSAVVKAVNGAILTYEVLIGGGQV